MCELRVADRDEPSILGRKGISDIIYIQGDWIGISNVLRIEESQSELCERAPTGCDKHHELVAENQTERP